MKYIKEIIKKPHLLLTSLLLIIIICNTLSNLIITSFNSVKVNDVSITNEDKNLQGTLYKPTLCNEDNPCPVIIMTNGELKTRDSLKYVSLELTKKNYIVLTIDMYDHGDSSWNTPYEYAFTSISMWDATKWVYDQDWSLKDNDGNGLIALCGFSTGGVSSQLAIYQDELSIQNGNKQKISALLTIGTDYKLSNSSIINMYKDRYVGMIMNNYDEYLDNDDGNVTYNNYLDTEEAQDFLNSNENKRFIYTLNEVSITNTISINVITKILEFFDITFNNTINTSRTYFINVILDLISLICLILLIFPLLDLLLKIPLLKETINEETPTKNNKIEILISLLISSLSLVILHKGSNIIIFKYLSELIIIISIILTLSLWIMTLSLSMLNKDNDKAKLISIKVTKRLLVIDTFALLLRYLSINYNKVLTLNIFYNSPSMNIYCFYFIFVSAILLVYLSIYYSITNKQPFTKVSIKKSLLTILLGILLFIIIYLVTLILNKEVINIKVFFTYLPFITFFFFITKDNKSLLNVIGFIILIIFKYVELLITRNSLNFYSESLYLLMLIPIFIISTLYNKRIIEKTNNPYISMVLNSLLFTLVLVGDALIYNIK